MHTRQIMMTSNHMKPRSSSSSTSKTGRSHSQIWISFDRKASFKCILLKLIINFHPRSVTILRWLLVNDSWPCIYYLEMRSVELEDLRWKRRGNIMTSYSSMNQSMTPHKNFFIKNPIQYSCYMKTE